MEQNENSNENLNEQEQFKECHCNEEHHHHNHMCCKDGCLKYAVIFFGTIIGAFLAFYFVADFTMKTLFNPVYQMHRAEKMMRDMDKQIDKDFNKTFKNFDKDMKGFSKVVLNPISIAENADGYVVTISLKQFGNTSKNVNVNVSDDNILKIEASNQYKKGNKENMLNMVQSYQLQRNVDFDKMTSKEEHGNYIVTIPFEVE